MSEIAGNTNNEHKHDQLRMAAVKSFALNVLEYGRDRYRENPSPLFADGVNTITGEHIKWRFPGGREAVMSNLGSQQNLLRTFAALSTLTSDTRFIDAAKSVLEYHFKYLQDPEGLLQWGGHRFIDLKTLEITGAEEKGGMVHELKNHLPYYELMFEVDAKAAQKFIEAVWNAHIYNWRTLELSRHGVYGLQAENIWDKEFVQKEPYFEATGLSFQNAGNDLIYAAALHYKFTSEKQALKWSKRLSEQYVRSRDPETKLGAYQFTQPRKTADTTDDSNTLSKYGDRAKRQFGPELGECALEGKVLLARHAETLYYENTLMQLQVFSELGEDAGELLQWTREGMLAYSRYAYIPETNMLRPMFICGIDLSDYELERNGYYGSAGSILKQYPAEGKHFLSFTRTFIATGEDEFWQTARAMAKGIGLGDIGLKPGEETALNFSTENDDARALYGVLELYKNTKDTKFLKLARTIGDNIVNNKFINGYFLPGKEYVNANFDTIEPLALLTLQAAIEGKMYLMPYFLDGSGFFHGDYEFNNGEVKSYKSGEIYREKRI